MKAVLWSLYFQNSSSLLELRGKNSVLYLELNREVDEAESPIFLPVFSRCTWPESTGSGVFYRGQPKKGGIAFSSFQ